MLRRWAGKTVGMAAAALLVYGLVGAGLRAVSPANWLPEWLGPPVAMATRVTPAGPVVVEKVQQLGRLETCRYQEQVVLEGETRGRLPLFLAGDRLLFVGRGEVVAGV